MTSKTAMNGMDDAPSSVPVRLLVAVFISGAAGLMYQLVWMRSFSLVIGSAHTAVAAVLAAYMGGLAIGGLLGARWASRLASPLRAFAGLEGAVALFALVFPFALQAAAGIVSTWLGSGVELATDAGWLQATVYGASSALAIAAPTICMGATLPVLVQGSLGRVGSPPTWLAQLYGVNTLGAAVGAGVGGFLLLPNLGLSASTWSAALLNLVAAALVLVGPSRTPVQPESLPAKRHPAKGDSEVSAPSDRNAWPFVLAAFLISAASFSLEVFWARLLSHLLGGTMQGFASMLCVTLLGIGAGGILAQRSTRLAADGRRWLILSLVVAAAAVIGAYGLLSMVAGDGLHAVPTLVVVLLAILPSSIAFGLSFPLLVRCGARYGEEYPRVTGWIFAASTTGAMVGALVTANVLLPAIRFEGVLSAAVGTLLLVIAGLAWPVASRTQRIAVLSGVLIAVVGMSWYLPAPREILGSSAVDSAQPTEERFLAVGRAATIQIQERGFGLLLRGDGLPEALVSRIGSPPGLDDQVWLGTLGAMSRPDARSMLVVGLGGGVTLEGIPPTIEKIDVVEIEPRVLEANRFIADERRHDPLRDGRVRVVLNDARNALQRTSYQYDIIVSQPSHPWTPASANLYSREFLASAKRRLTADGVFVQWMNAGFVSEELFRSLVATLAAEYRHLIVYEPVPMSLVFLASDTEVDPRRWFASGRSRTDEAARALARAGITLPEDLDWSLLLADRDLRALSANAKPITDDLNRLAMRSRPGAGMSESEFSALVGPYDRVRNLAANGAAADYILQRLAEARPDRSARATPLMERASSEGRDFDIAIRNAVTLASGRASDEVMSVARRLPDSAAAVVQGWEAARAGAVSTLRDLDPVLAKTLRTDSWFAASSRLRAEWRLDAAARADADSMERKAYVSEALAIIDSALVSGVTTDLLFQRAAAAELAVDPDILIESSAALADLVHKKFLAPSANGGPSGDIALQSKRLQALRSLLVSLPETPRVRQVIESLDGTLNGVAQLTVAEPRR
jgi:spermidine synthase